MGAVLKYWSGSAWVPKPLKYWNGSAWVEKTLKYWDGASWIGAIIPAEIYIDNFDRANANLEASVVASGGWNWVHDGLIAGAISISSNQARSNTSLTTGSAYTAATLSSADHYVQFSVVQIAGSPGSFFACRLADNANFIGIRSRATNIEVFRYVASTATSLYIGTGLSAINDVFRLVVQGSNFSVYKNGVLLTGPTAIGATLTSMKVGLRGNAAASSNMGDNFQAGTLTAFSYADTFNRADANLESSATASGSWTWTHDAAIAGALAIVSNQLNCTTTNAAGSAYKTPSLGSADHYVQYKAPSVSLATGTFMCCRLLDNSNFIGIRTGNGGANGQIEVYRRNAGTLSSLYASATGAFVVGDTIRLEVIGNFFIVKKNGVLVTGPTAIGGTVLTAQTAGINARTTTGVVCEDFEAGRI